MRIIGVDLSYAKPIKIAVLSSRGKLIMLLTVKPKDDLFHTAEEIHSAILPICDSLVVFEKIGIYNNIATGLKLAKMTTVLHTLLKCSGFQVRQISPISWQKDLLGVLKKGETKKASVTVADKMFGSKIPHPITPDEADALNIAYYGVKHYRQLIKESDEI